MPIYTRQGVLKYDAELQELIENKDLLPVTQHDRKRDGKIKFHNCDFSRQDVSGMRFDGMVFDQTDWSYANLKGCVFYKCGLRQVKMNRAVLEGATFINCNFREGEITECFAEGSTFINCTMIHVDLRKTQFQWSTFKGNDMRKVNARNCDMTECEFDQNKLRGINMRNAFFTHSSAPRFFYDSAMSMDYANPEDWFYGYKLTAANGKGIYHPKITYSVGKVFDATVQDGVEVPLHPKHNTGIALAPLDWVLREWVLCGAYPDYRVFRCKFQAKDIMNNEGNTKFNVSKMEIVEEIDIAPFYEEMNEDIDYSLFQN